MTEEIVTSPEELDKERNRIAERKMLVRRTCGEPARLYPVRKRVYSTVTLLARFRGLSISQPRWRAT